MQAGISITNTAPVAGEASVVRTVARHALLLAGLLVLLSAAYWGAVHVVAGGPGMPLDDSYIHLQYARSIYEGRWFEYNPGVRSTGTSAPLWTVMLPLTYMVTRDWLTASYLLGVLWTVACVVLTYWLALRWTQRRGWALFAAAMLLLANPTVISAYGGMEVSAYVGMFLLGLLLYDFSRTALPARQMYWRLAGSVAFAVGVWLRPEFLLMPVLIACERMITLRGTGRSWPARWFGEMVLHGFVWMVLLAPYLAFNKWAADTWLPNTYTIKAVARNATAEGREMAGLPTAWAQHDWRAAGRLVVMWLPLAALTTILGLMLNNAVLAWRLPRAIRRSLSGGMMGPAGFLAAISLIGFPLARAMVDPIGQFPFQFQRYFGHLTAAMVLLGATMLAIRSGTDQPGRRLWVGSVAAGVFGLLATSWLPVMAVGNINQMQVDIGRWIDQNTPADAVVATNDAGAIAFCGRRRIVDTVGLTEPPLVKWYMAGGNLEGYLRQQKPTYACLFPNWHDRLADRADLFEPVYKVELKDNVICGGREMKVLRTCWDGQFHAGWDREAKARKERIARRAAKASATQAARIAQGQ